MKVDLLSYTDKIIDVIYTACRTCYSKEVPMSIFNKDIEKDKKIDLIKKVINSGHLSTVEHAYFTFTIEGVSRALLAQITRHRLCSFSVQSQRYVEIKDNAEELRYIRDFGTEFDKMKILNKYFVCRDYNEEISNTYISSLITYLNMTSQGIKSEDARMVLPNATKTNIVLSCNLRELIHICNLRLCKHAQLEIRTMVKNMKECVLKSENCEWLNSYLVPQCKICTDFRDCKEGK